MDAISPNYPTASREMSQTERLVSVAQSLGVRAAEMAEAATRVIQMREEYGAAQQRFDQTAAAYRDAHHELSKLLEGAGVTDMAPTAAKPY